MKKRPVLAAAVAHPPPHADYTLFFPLTCPERGDSEVQPPLRALTLGAVGTSGASGEERRRRRQGRGRQRESQQSPAAAVSLPIPVGLGQRTPHGHRGRMSQARGRAARGAGPWRGAGMSLLPHWRGGGSLCGEGRPLPVPPKSRGAAGPRHRAHRSQSSCLRWSPGAARWVRARDSQLRRCRC